MSVPHFNSYNASGTDWLGELPPKWDVRLARRLFQQTREAAKEGDEQLSATQRYGVVPQKLFMELEGQNVMLALGGIGNFKHVEKDDFVISLRSFQGGIEYSAYSGCVSPAYTVLRARKEISASYYAYTFKSSVFVSALQTTTDGIRDGKNISYDQFGGVSLPLPPLPDQTAIAAFLDRETAKIDALVEEQKRLINLLKEKRQAVISHAVTKGLNPDAPMKDSGIEWLGEVPEHWEVVQLGRCFRSMVYGISEALAPEGAVAILRMGNIQDGAIDLRDLKYVDSVDDELLLEEDDLLYNRTNSLELIGKVGRYIPEGGEPVSFASYLVRLRAHVDCSSLFLSYALNTDGILGAARSRAFVSIGQCNLNPTRYSEIAIAKPPLDEQLTIAGFLGEAVGAIDEMSTQAKKSIDLLNERRSALISAAVTGKIDVQNFARTRDAAE